MLFGKQFYLCHATYFLVTNINKNYTTVAYENNDKKMESVYSKRIRAGKRRTYFFDVRETRGSDYYLTITESRKRFDSEGYDRHKIFLYKEDFEKFADGLKDTIDYIKANQEVVEKRYEFNEAPEVANTATTTDDDFSFEI